MGHARHLCYVLNAARRRRENGEEERRPGVMPLIGRGIRPVVLHFQHWDRVLGGNNYNYNYSTRGRSRSFPAPQPYLEIRRQPHSLPHCLAAGFGHVAPNNRFPPRLNSPPLHAPNPPCYVPPPPSSPQNQTDSETESNELKTETESTSSGFNSKSGDSLTANCRSP